MNKLLKLIYLILILTLTFSCVEKQPSQKEISKSEFVNLSESDSLHFNSGIQAIFQDSKGNYWFGDRDTGAWKFDGKTMTNYIVDAKLSTPMIWDIAEDNDKNLLFAMGKGGVYKFNGKSFDKIF